MQLQEVVTQKGVPTPASRADGVHAPDQACTAQKHPQLESAESQSHIFSRLLKPLLLSAEGESEALPEAIKKLLAQGLAAHTVPDTEKLRALLKAIEESSGLKLLLALFKEHCAGDPTPFPGAPTTSHHLPSHETKLSHSYDQLCALFDAVLGDNFSHGEVLQSGASCAAQTSSATALPRGLSQLVKTILHYPEEALAQFLEEECAPANSTDTLSEAGSKQQKEELIKVIGELVRRAKGALPAPVNPLTSQSATRERSPSLQGRDAVCEDLESALTRYFGQCTPPQDSRQTKSLPERDLTTKDPQFGIIKPHGAGAKGAPQLDLTATLDEPLSLAKELLERAALSPAALNATLSPLTTLQPSPAQNTQFILPLMLPVFGTLPLLISVFSNTTEEQALPKRKNRTIKKRLQFSVECTGVPRALCDLLWDEEEAELIICTGEVRSYELLRTAIVSLFRSVGFKRITVLVTVEH